MKTQKPFTPDPKKKVDALVDAATHVYGALAALDEAKKFADHWAEYETLNYFKMELEQFISCDNGEAGFEPYMVKQSEEVFKGRRNPIKDARKIAQRYQAFNKNGRQVHVSIPEG